MAITAPTLRSFIIKAIKDHGLDVASQGARATRAELDALADLICSQHGLVLTDDGFAPRPDPDRPAGRSAKPFEARKPLLLGLSRELHARRIGGGPTPRPRVAGR